MSDIKESNPKDAIAGGKIPFHLWPDIATALGALGLLDGALKYGRTNWRVAGVKITVYLDAIRRHAAAWQEGEDADPDSGLPHLAHILASAAILADAEAAGKVIDDRNYPGGYRAGLDALTPHVARLVGLDRPIAKSFTIKDGLLPHTSPVAPAYSDPNLAAVLLRRSTQGGMP